MNFMFKKWDQGRVVQDGMSVNRKERRSHLCQGSRAREKVELSVTEVGAHHF